MATDSRYRIIIEGDASDALEKVDRVVASINKSKKAAEKFSKERNTIARDERRERFRALSDEEKRLRLTQRQIDLEKKLSRARAQGNQGRTGAIELLLARNRQTMGALGSSGGGVSRPSGGSVLGGAGALAGIAGIGLTIRAIGSSMVSALRSSINFADQVGDLADQTNETRENIIKLQRQAQAVGISPNKVFAGLSALGAARGAALSGDENALRNFDRFGIGKNNLNPNGSLADLGTRISESLGNAGITGSDRNPLGALFGRRPELVVAALRARVNTSDLKGINEQFANVEGINNRLESSGNSLNVAGVKATSFLANALKTHASALTKIFSPVGNALNKIPAIGVPTAIAGMFFKGTGLLGTESLPTDFGKRTAKSRPIPKGANFLDLPLRDVIAGEGLSRIGFASGARDPQGAGLAQKQLQALQDLGKTAKETKMILEEGNR